MLSKVTECSPRKQLLMEQKLQIQMVMVGAGGFFFFFEELSDDRVDADVGLLRLRGSCVWQDLCGAGEGSWFGVLPNLALYAVTLYWTSRGRKLIPRLYHFDAWCPLDPHASQIIFLERRNAAIIGSYFAEIGSLSAVEVVDVESEMSCV